MFIARTLFLLHPLDLWLFSVYFVLKYPSVSPSFFSEYQESVMPITPCPLRQLLSLATLAWQLGQPLADNAIRPACKYVTRNIIPVTRCPARNFYLSGIHVGAWLSTSAIRFARSPVCVNWNRVIVPVESGWNPVQPDPNLFKWFCFLSHEFQDKLVFFRTVNLHQASTQGSAIRLSLGPSLDGTMH